MNLLGSGLERILHPTSASRNRMGANWNWKACRAGAGRGSSPTHCGLCQALSPQLEKFHHEHLELAIIMISRAEPNENRFERKQHGLTIASEQRRELLLASGPQRGVRRLHDGLWRDVRRSG